MNQTQYNFSTSKTLVNILVYFLLFWQEIYLAVFLLICFFVCGTSEQCTICNSKNVGGFITNRFPFWLYTTKGLHLKMKDFGITPNIKNGVF